MIIKTSKMISILTIVAIMIISTAVPALNQTAAAAARTKCNGETTLSISPSKFYLYLIVKLQTNSCDTEKVVEVLDDASGGAGAVAGIMAAVPALQTVGAPVAGAVAGVLWLNKFAIKK